MQQAVQPSTPWKQAAMQNAEKLTDVWDVVKSWLGRAAEIILTICMFAQLIGMLPGVNYPLLLNNVILGVQIIMLDFGAFALAPLAEHARAIGQDEAAKRADDMATFLIWLVMITILIIIVGQFSAIFGAYAQYVNDFVKYAEPVLILVRVGSVVKYIHVIHSLRGSTAIAPIPQPEQQKTIDDILARIDRQAHHLSTVEQSIATLAQQISVVQHAGPGYAEMMAQLNDRISTLSKQRETKPLPVARAAEQKPQPGSTREQVRALRAEGLGVSEIAARLSKSRQAIYAHIRVIEQEEEHAA